MKACLFKFLRYPVNAPRLVLIRSEAPQTVLIDFSSPNIAKPFHLGHFRATVTGNFIRNINEAMNNRVVAVNYLGDWGTQFELLANAFQRYGSWDELHTNPMRHLQEIYVKANAEIAKESSTSAELGNPSLNMSDPDKMAWWTEVRQITIDHLTQTYMRMNVQFDAFEYESDCVADAKQLVEQLVAQGMADRDADGVISFRSKFGSPSNPRIALLKSNGSTLYLTRDIATALSRYKRYEFDRIHYVVEDGQRLHFQHLCTVLQQLNCPWWNIPNPDDPSAEHACSFVHVPFGRVHGASTRHGQGVTLTDILNSAQQTVLQRMSQSPTTRVSHGTNSALSAGETKLTLDVADHLGVTCLTVEMLRQRRQKPIRLRSFLGVPVTQSDPSDRDEMSNVRRDQTDLSGLGLQYCHARLCSLEQRAIQSGLVESDSITLDMTGLCNRLDNLDSTVWSHGGNHPALNQLHAHLLSFESSLRSAYMNYEASILVQFATKLTTLINVAWKQVPVLTCPNRGEQLLRLAVFMAAKNALATCLRLLGIRPLRNI